MAKSRVNNVLYQCFTGSLGQSAAERIARDAKLDFDSEVVTAAEVTTLNFARKLLRSAGFEMVLRRRGVDEVVESDDKGNAIDNFLEG
jgi:hypothetical protein